MKDLVNCIILELEILYRYYNNDITMQHKIQGIISKMNDLLFYRT